MKRIANYLIVLALAVFTFTSCEDIPSPFGQIVAPKTDDGVVIEPSGKGTLADPYNVAGALEFIAGLGADVQSPTDVYIKGYVTTITEAFGTQYGNATFEISDTKEGANKFLCYRVKYFGGQGYSDPSATNIKEGDEVIICGKVVNYKGNTPETAANAAYVYSINGKGGGTTPPDPGTGDAKGKGTQDDPFNIAAAIKKCQEVGETTSTDKYYIKGIVVKGGTVSGGYGNVTFTLGDTKDATDVFTAFQVAGTDGEKLADGYEVPAGAEVVVYGPVVNYKGNTPETAGKSAAQIVTVNGKKTNEGGDNPPAGGNDGSLEKPFTPAEANAFIATLAADTNTDKDYYIKGKIIDITEKNQFNTQYGNCTFYISDDGTDKDEKFYVFRTLYLENVKYTDDSWAKPAAKDEVIICGKLVNYKGNTPETVANQSYIYSLNGKTKADEGSSTAGNDGSLEKPFTPAEANAFIATLAADTNTDKDYYIKGKIIEITDKNQFGTQYGNCTFYISDDGTDKDDKFYVFRTLYLGNVKYTDDSWTKPAAKDEVIICGKLVNYKGNTPETVANQSYIYSLNGKTK